MKRFIGWWLIVLLPGIIWAQKKPGDAATIKSAEVQGAAKPGGTVTALVKVQLEKGYHTHSNQPSEKNFIPTVLSLTAPKSVTAGKVKYPAGKSHKVEGLDKPLSVYESEFEVSVPLTLSGDAVLPITIPGTLKYQACQGAQCYPPRSLKFDLVIPDAAAKE